MFNRIKKFLPCKACEHDYLLFEIESYRRDGCRFLSEKYRCKKCGRQITQTYGIGNHVHIEGDYVTDEITKVRKR